jgi:hypothetical protein
MLRAQYRQGDVLLVRVDAVPKKTSLIARENGRVILAHGEATGHSHAILDERVELVAPDGSAFVSVDEAAELYLLVHGSDPVDLVHDEHDPIAIEPGEYRVVRQREYTPEQTRFVAD